MFLTMGQQQKAGEAFGPFSLAGRIHPEAPQGPFGAVSPASIPGMSRVR
jgi:hypothetical protein